MEAVGDVEAYEAENIDGGSRVVAVAADIDESLEDGCTQRGHSRSRTSRSSGEHHCSRCCSSSTRFLKSIRPTVELRPRDGII